jgi:hypothetical protein
MLTPTSRRNRTAPDAGRTAPAVTAPILTLRDHTATFAGSAAPQVHDASSLTSPQPGPGRDHPWAIVKAFYNDITVRDYAAAWRLLGYQPRGAGFASFVAGYASTGRQTVSKISQSGDQVSFTFRSDNPDGTVQTYQGTDSVTGGKIVTSNVVQTGGPASA